MTAPPRARGGFWYAEAIRNSDLPPTARLVALVLAGIADNDSGRVVISLGTKPKLPGGQATGLVRFTGLSRRAVQDALKLLEAGEWLRRSVPPVWQQRAEHAMTTYTLLIPAAYSMGGRESARATDATAQTQEGTRARATDATGLGHQGSRSRAGRATGLGQQTTQARAAGAPSTTSTKGAALADAAPTPADYPRDTQPTQDSDARGVSAYIGTGEDCEHGIPGGRDVSRVQGRLKCKDCRRHAEAMAKAREIREAS